MANVKNIVLVGFMGSGKSLTSKRLAELLDREVVSTDGLIEQKEGRAITDIFGDSGEVYFRKVESDAVKEVSDKTNIIVDCGGGVVLSCENMDNLKKSGCVFYLSATPEYIYNNIKHHTHRPLLDVENPQAKIAELLNARKSYYEQADVIIDANRPINEIVEDIIKEIT